MNYNDFLELPRSEKITLITCEAVKQAKVFELYSGNTYKKVVDHFVSFVKRDGLPLESGIDKDTLSPEQYFFDAPNKTIYINVSIDPKFLNISIVYKFFFSNTPIILPFDLDSGIEVEWLPYVQSIGSIGQELDDENIGIVLESSSSVDFVNSQFFQGIIDTLIFENQKIDFYSCFGGLPKSEIKRIFSGVVESKEYTPSKTVFRVKDFVYKLRNKVNLGTFSDSDGTIEESILGTPKRRIYGISKQSKCIPVDCTLDGYNLTGTISFVLDSDSVIGVGTEFLKELKQNDEISYIVEGEEIKYTVNLISSNTSMTISNKAKATVNNVSIKVSPSTPYRFKNRLWHVAGHPLRETTEPIVDVINARTFVIDAVTEFSAGDVVRVEIPSGYIVTAITRVSGFQLILEQNIFPIPQVGYTITRFPIKALHYGETLLIPDRDFTLINSPEAVIELNEFAEFNIAKEIRTSNTLTFNVTNPALRKEISTTASVDLRTIIKPGDWIRADVQDDADFYEVHYVEAQKLYITEDYSSLAATATKNAIVRKTNNIDESSLILADCYGKEVESRWAKNAADCVYDLVKSDAGFNDIDLDSFDQAGSDCNFTLSLIFPEIGQEAPTIRSIIELINESVFGSLYGNSSQEIAFSIVNARRPDDMKTIKDTDIISWDVKTTQRIISDVKINYLPFVDKTSGDNGFTTLTYSNDFVNNNIGIKNTSEKTCYLYNESEALVIAQRIAFYNSLSSSSITINAKANFFNVTVNDRIYIDFDRLYKRYGGSSQLKVGVISGKKVSAYSSTVVMNDLGNIFNRGACIAPDLTPSFTNADDDAKIKHGFIVDSDTWLPDNDEINLGSNLIG